MTFCDLVNPPQPCRFLFLRSNGSNGKGTFLQIMRRILGEENCTSLSLKEMADMRYKVTMVGMLANFGDDIQPEMISNDQMKVLKNISSADNTSCRKLNKQSFSSVISAKFYFTTNSDIRSYEKGEAYKRRVMWIPMEHHISRPDPHFLSRVTSPEALRYWMRLLAEAYQRLCGAGRFSSCAAVDAYNRDYHRNNNYMNRFLETMDIDTQVLGHTATDLRRQYEMTNDDPSCPYSPELLAQALKELGIESRMKKINGSSCRVFCRIDSTGGTDKIG